MVMPPGWEFCSRVALGGGALEVDLHSVWSDSENCGCSQEDPM